MEIWLRLSVSALAPLLIAVGAIGAGCVSDPPARLVSDVVPEKGWIGADVEVLVGGENFFPMTTASAAQRGAASVDRDFHVTLVNDGAVIVDLGRVELLDTETLRAVVPSGVEAGRYDVQVTWPDGEARILPDAYLATRSQADRLRLVPVDARPVVTVHETVQVDLAVVDPGGDVVGVGLPVQLWVEALRGSADSLVVGGDLIDVTATPQPNGWVIDGTIPARGEARVSFLSEEPVELSVQARTDEDGVGSDVAFLTWEAGSGYRVDVELPFQGEVVAGERFDVALTLRDEFGNRVDDPRFRTDAVLVDTCGDLFPVPAPDLRGTKVIPSIRMRRATGGEACPRQALQVVLGGEVHSSADFQVLPAPVARFAVQVASTAVVAGEVQRATVQAVDAWGNPVPWDGRADRLQLTDTAGDVRVVGCEPGDAFVTCSFTPTNAENGVVLQVVDPEGGLTGSSQPYAVLAAALDNLQVLPDPAAVASGIRAGDPFDVTVLLRDRFGNDVPAETLAVGDVVLTDAARAEADCAWIGPGERGQVEFTCTLYSADHGVALVATGAGEVTGRSLPFPVHNGALARVDVAAGAARVTVGETLPIDLHGFDAWGNPYLMPIGVRVDLADDLGSWSTRSATFSGTSTVRVEGILTVAGTTRIRVARGGVELGTSEVLVVQAGRPSRVEVEPVDPWGWRGASSAFDLQVVDAWGNPVDTDEAVTLSSASDAAPAVTATLVDGRARASLTWTGAALNDTVKARTASGTVGDAAGYLVVVDCGSSGPTMNLTFDGARDAIACHDGVSASVEASFAGSAQSGGKAPIRYAVWTPELGVEAGTSDVIDLELDEMGRVPVRAVVVGDGYCAVETSRTAWVGPDDGQPVGPLKLTLTRTTLATGRDTTTAAVSAARACDGTAASKGRVYLRTNLGVLTGGTASGRGLRLTLDTTGDGSMTLDLGGARTGGAGLVSAWVDSGAAAGEVAFVATGDAARPRVISQSPRGFRSSDVGSVRLSFSEPLDPASVTAAQFSLVGPAAGVVDAVSLLSDREVEVRFVTPLSATAGKWTIAAGSSIKDASGNGLDGGWDGKSGDHVASFGKVSALAPDLVSCSASTTTFRPDGDDGRGMEADKVTFSLSASRSATTWVLQVWNAAGERVWVDRVAAGGAKSGSVVWEGRGFDGRVLKSGEYDAILLAENADGTSGLSCGQGLVLDQR